MRIGIGYDIHRFGEEPPLILGGLEFSDQPRLVGHSDGDAVLHAVSDALLGAAALGDIGDHFPDTSPEWKDADSAELLRRVVRLVAQRQELVAYNVDLNIIAERPRLGVRKHEMRRRLAALLELPVERVSVKARTAERLGPVGRGEALEVHAAVLMKEI